jgi:hypothetical protein
MNREQAKQAILKHNGAGWLPLVDKAYDFLANKAEVTEVFEKWGKLKIRIKNLNLDKDIGKSIDNFLSEIEEESSYICAVCGEEGVGQAVGGWLLTLCDKHYHEMTNK